MSQILEMLLAEARAIESSAGRNYFYSPDGKMVEVPDNRLSRHTSYTDFIKRHPPLVTTELISPEPGIISLERVIGKPQYKSPVSIEPPGGNIDTIPYLNITAEIGRFGDPIARFILRNLSLPINRRFY
ncbi:hypothetical protein H3C65_01705 [Patescibacteria group bacterium]|nr:hypothetical protein [Patescibacteria group bacterium]